MVLRVFVMVLVAVAITAESVPARADAAEVEALITKGNDLRRDGKAGAALPYFQKAYELTRTPRTAGQLGLAELSAGYPVEAFDHIASTLDSPNDPWTQRYRQMLTDALTMARSRIGEIAVSGGPNGAEVVVNGRTVGRLPLPSTIKLAATNAEVVVRAPGYAERREHVRVASGHREELTLTLEPVAKPAEAAKPMVLVPAAIPPAAPPPAGSAASVNVSPLVAEERTGGSDASGSSLRTAAWITGGGALAAAGAGLALNLMARSSRSAFDADCVKRPGEPIAPTTTKLSMNQCIDHYDDWVNQRRWSIVGYATGAALAVTSGILFWTSQPAGSTKDTHAHLTCAPTLNGLSCRSSF